MVLDEGRMLQLLHVAVHFGTDVHGQGDKELHPHELEGELEGQTGSAARGESPEPGGWRGFGSFP